jgi:hypothetical protein
LRGGQEKEEGREDGENKCWGTVPDAVTADRRWVAVRQ